MGATHLLDARNDALRVSTLLILLEIDCGRLTRPISGACNLPGGSLSAGTAAAVVEITADYWISATWLRTCRETRRILGLRSELATDSKTWRALEGPGPHRAAGLREPSAGRLRCGRTGGPG